MSNSDNPCEMRVVNPGNLGSSSRMFDNTHGTSINGGAFISVGRDQINVRDSRTAREILSEFTKDIGAAHDSAERYPHPRCHPETRQEIKDDILQWCRDPSSDVNVFWVHGPAGVGKSAIAQTIAELAESDGLLASSFFFSRNEGKRSDPTYFIPTIAYQLACRIPELNVAMTEVIQQNPGILYSSFDIQFTELLANSYWLAIELHGRDWISHLTRRVIVIDGIDECETRRTITQRLLRYGEIRPQDVIPPIASILAENLPFRFLLFSRPEPCIREALEAASFGPHMWHLGLGDSLEARRDIETFLRNEFSSIRTNPRNVNVEFPDIWPAPGVIDKLVDKACGQFIYAATVLKFVNDEYSQPIKQLSIVLGLSPTLKGNSPFKDLDVLYRQILSSNPDQCEVMRILHALLWLQAFPCDMLPPNPKNIGKLLGLEKGEVSAMLRGMHSVLEVGGPDTDIWILHLSFLDFLCQKSRSGPYHIKFDLYFVLPHWSWDLQRMLAEPATFICLWLAPILQVTFIGTMICMISKWFVDSLFEFQWPNHILFIECCIWSILIIVLLLLLLHISVKCICLHGNQFTVKIGLVLGCIAATMPIILPLLHYLAHVYGSDT
ncbi:nwd2 [Moniliophthora roreri MCA 2997]|uniref:Nwd2 n=1 Tax=Moniliophthora roreri (strain MCA 2997) TaxID=1381753 RepID=V2X2V7_MONRO|nr:nwd2 [Moniliophthora roreri MCA 2997]